MRSPGSALVMAANQTSAVDVLFDVDHDVIRQKWLFSARQYSKFFEKLQNFFCFNFRATPWSNNISSTNQKTLKEQAGDLFYFVCLLLLAWPLFLYVLKACVPKILLLYTCRTTQVNINVTFGISARFRP